MAIKEDVFVNNNPPACEYFHLNGFLQEINNAIKAAGLSLIPGNYTQLAEAISVMAHSASDLDGIKATGFARAYSAHLDFGGSVGDWSTLDFVNFLNSVGAFDFPFWFARASWKHSNNKTITDTGFGRLNLSGCTVEVMGGSNEYTIRVTTPTTSTDGGITNTVFTYVNNGNSYSPGWIKDLYHGGNIDGDLSANNLTSRGNVSASGQVSGSTVKSNGAIGATGIIKSKNDIVAFDPSATRDAAPINPALKKILGPAADEMGTIDMIEMLAERLDLLTTKLKEHGIDINV